MQQATRYSPKREAILQCLRSTTCHPSAEWVYSQLKPQIPDLSLATVYRNLARFRSEGAVQEKRAIAKNLKHAGIPVDVIAENTGLTAEEIENL